MATLTMATLSMATLSMATLTMATLTMATLTMATLTMATLTMATLTVGLLAPGTAARCDHILHQAAHVLRRRLLPTTCDAGRWREAAPDPTASQLRGPPGGRRYAVWQVTHQRVPAGRS